MALSRTLTVADLYAMPESERGERYELIDGELFVTPAPTWRHQTVSTNILIHFSGHVRSMRLGWVRDNVGVRIGESTYVIPDLVFISRERQNIIGEANIVAAPDLVVEILSPGTGRNDLVLKRSLYARIGVREYWIIEPVAQVMTVLRLEAGDYVEIPLAVTGAVRSDVLPGLHLTLENVFEEVDIVQPGNPGS